jgi:hypothetical protein
MTQKIKIWSKYPDGDKRNCRNCKEVGMENIANLFEGEGLDPSQIWQCPKCKTIDQLY